MSTRSAIIIENTDGTAEGIYCHFDGYLDGKRDDLLVGYQDEEKVRALIALGDISSLGREIGEKHDFNHPPEGVVNAYGRDRGESDIEAKKGESWRKVAAEIGHNGYIYVFVSKEGIWKVAFDESGDLVSLADAKEPD
jgi:hypothetical protein